MPRPKPLITSWVLFSEMVIMLDKSRGAELRQRRSYYVLMKATAFSSWMLTLFEEPENGEPLLSPFTK